MSVVIDLDSEIYKQLGVNTYERSDLKFDESDQIVEPGTIHQIETFHQWLISDVYKRQKVIKYDACLSDENIHMTKKYYIVPLKLVKNHGWETSS